MKTIALLHTVRSVLETFPQRLRQAMPGQELSIHNTLDEFLASDANLHGFTQANQNRLLLMLKAMEMERPDIIVVTCSTLTPGAQLAKPYLSVPLVCIDDAMAEAAVLMGPKIAVLATAQSTVGPTLEKLRQEATRLGRGVELTSMVCDEAYTAMKAMDMAAHDRLVLEAAQGIHGQDVVVLAQASMAHLERQVEAACHCKAVSSPGLCVERVRQRLEQISKG